MLEANEKNKSLNKDIKDKEEPNKFRTEKYSNKNLKTQWIDSIWEEEDRWKKQWTGRQNDKNYLMWATERKWTLKMNKMNRASGT